VRSNETLGDAGIRPLEVFMQSSKVTSLYSVPRSLCGITSCRSSLEIRMPDADLIEARAICADLEFSLWKEGVSDAMGGTNKKKEVTHLHRRGWHKGVSDEWQPLIWAVRQNQLLIVGLLLEHGHDVNKPELVTDKSNGFTPLHWAVQKVAAALDCARRARERAVQCVG
jgi:hypothetical protein